ncbi:MAG TPA: GAF domain-containing protein [Bryobacteraceae bacterium]|jgi:GAF domain-containing protein/ligand-binding sensor protein|nr:GAF domain-containing protein [Bryobacteraceae bacterium]
MRTQSVEATPTTPGLLKNLGGTRLHEILRKHSKASRLVAIVIDRDGHSLAGPADCCAICEIAGETSSDHLPCGDELLRRAAASDGPVTFACAAGIHAAIAAIRVGDQVAGYVVGAQSIEAPLSDEELAALDQRIGPACHHQQKDRLDVLRRLPLYPTEQHRLEAAKELQGMASEITQLCWYEQQLLAIEKANARMAELTSPKDVADATIEGVSKIFGEINAALYILEKGGLLRCLAKRIDPDVFTYDVIHPGEGRVGWVAVNRRPLLATEDSPCEVPPIVREGHSNSSLKSDLTVPVFGEGDEQLIGVLQAASKRLGTFQDSHKNLVQMLGNLAGLHLKRVADPATEAAVLRPVLQNILEIAFEQIGFSSGDIGLLDATGSSLEIYAAMGELRDSLPVIVPSGAGISGRVMRENRTIVVNDMSTDVDYTLLREKYDESTAYGRFLQAVACTAKTPLRINGKVIGILCVHWNKPNQVPARTVPALESLAERISAIIEVSRNQERSWTHSFLRQRLTSGVEIQAAKNRLYQAISDEALRLTGSLRASMREYDTQLEQLRIVGTSGAGWTDNIRKRIKHVSDRTAGSRAIRTKEPCVISDVKLADDFWELFDDVRSHISVPVFFRNGVVGVLSVDSDRLTAYSSMDVARMVRLGMEFAEVLEHFALHQDEWLLDLEQFMAKTKDLEQLCSGAMSRVRSLFGVRACSVYLQKPGTRVLQLTAAFPPQEPCAEEYELGEGLTGWVAEQKKILRLRDARDPAERSLYSPPPTHTNKSFDAITYAPDRLTFLAAPLVVHETLLGVLRLAILEGGAEFTSADEVLISRLSAALALSIQNNWLAAAKERAIAQLKALNKLGQKLSATLSLDSVAKIVLEDGLPLLGCDAGHIRVFDAKRRHLKLVEAAGLNQEKVKPIRGLGEGISGRVFQSKRPWYIRDLTTDPKAKEIERDDWGLQPDELSNWIGSVTCYPLTVQGEPIGTINVHWRNTQILNRVESLRLLKDIANRTAVAMKAALLVREIEGELKRKIESMSRLSDFGLRFARTLNVDDLLHDILATAIHEFGADSGGLRTVSDRGDQWILRTALDADGKSIMSDLDKALPKSGDLLSRVALGRQVKVIEDLRGAEFQEFLRDISNPAHRAYLNSLSSLVIVPMWLRDRCKGLLFLATIRPTAPTPAITEFLGMLAAYAVVAIENADLYAEREKELRLATPLAMMGTMLGSFEHVMRGGLQAIAGGLETLSIRPELQAVAPRVDKVRQSVMRLGEIVSDVAVFTGTAPAADRDRLDVNCAVDKSVRELRFGLSGEESRPDIRFETSLAEVCTIRGNRVQLEQAFKLILGNAVQAMPDGGTITVRTELRPGEAVVSFCDTGIGMDEHTLSKCLEPFYTTKDKDVGRGLGLSVVYGIVRRHGGTIDIQSSPGRGTEVTLSFNRREVH